MLTTVTEFSMNSGDPTQITVGPANNLWVTEPSLNALGMFNPATDTPSSPVVLNSLMQIPRNHGHRNGVERDNLVYHRQRGFPAWVGESKRPL